MNEFLLVAIGVLVASVVNLFHDNNSQKEKMMRDIRYTEQKLKEILEEMAAYLSDQPTGRDVWKDLRQLEEELEDFLKEAYEYQENAYHSSSEYYSEYFEMRMNQCNVLHNLHYKIEKIRTIPKQAAVIADYIRYLTDFVTELNVPTLQLEKLSGIFESMKKEPLPESREEFENRAMLYHILMDLEEFLITKRRFVNREAKKGS